MLIKVEPRRFDYKQYLRRKRMRNLALGILCIFAFFILLGLVCCKPQAVKPEEPAPLQVPVNQHTEFVLDWGHPEWTAELLARIGEHMPAFNTAAKDMVRFCPHYAQLDKETRAKVLAVLAVAIAKRESNFKTETVYKESTGVDSIGLYQLSYGDKYCPTKKASGDLKDPLINIGCAVKLMASYSQSDQVIAAGGYVKYGAPPARGLARYWSVLRVPDSKSKHHLAEIIARTQLAPGCL